MLLLLVSLHAFGQDGGVAFETTVTEDRRPVASSIVRQADFERRLPRSAPDALRYEPGVFIQQTAHGQASVFIRGLTGQQTVLMFDGIRLNTSTWRQGPNQYFFTLDAASIDSLEVLRGGSSTRYGSDALGGVIAASPIEAPVADGKAHFTPTLMLKATSADQEAGGRFGLLGSIGPVGFVGGLGLRHVGLLESAGPLPGAPADVPRFAPDHRTQLGTGFNEFTADGRVTWRPSATDEFTLASNAYRQFDAPRTDQCPPAFARSDECLTYTEQFRTLTYAAWKGRFTDVESARVTLSWQRQSEAREGARPASFVLNTGRDTVDTLGASLVLNSRRFTPHPGLTLELTFGADAYFDLVQSRSFVAFTDIAVVRELSRGQYLTGSTSLTGGAFVDGALAVGHAVTLRVGGRSGVAALNAPSDAPSGTTGVRGAWVPLAAHLGVEWRPLGPLTLFANLDRSFRAPNLDDLSSRQQTGPGFQFENPALNPERATTAELGARFRLEWLSLDAWAFQTWLEDAVIKQPREVTQCPPSTPQCASAWFRYQLQNVQGLSHVRGLEGSARLRLPAGFGARATAAYTFGEGPTRVPLSRIPPVNGTVELTWRHEAGVVLAGAFRWAGPQARLAVADLSDARIPLGGTPGYAVVDLRASVRVSPVVLTLVMENVLDAPWRAHGSSINGPGRGLMVLMTLR